MVSFGADSVRTCATAWSAAALVGGASAVFESDDELVCRARPLEHDDGPPLESAAEEVVGLASFSASVALIESSFAQKRSNLDLHASECGPS